MDHRRRRLLFHGLLLFLLGLATGLFQAEFENPRMGLAAHLEGVMNGIFLLALGGIWSEVRLPRRAASAAFGLVLFGTYANWATTTVAAIFGTGAMTPLASGTHRGLPWQEGLVTVGFASVGFAMLAAAGILLWGLRGGAPPSTEEAGPPGR